MECLHAYPFAAMNSFRELQAAMAVGRGLALSGVPGGLEMHGLLSKNSEPAIPARPRSSRPTLVGCAA